MSDEPAKTGRPLRGAAPGRPVTLRATDEERAAWTAAAGEQSLSEWLRAIANRAAKRAK